MQTQTSQSVRRFRKAARAPRKSLSRPERIHWRPDASLDPWHRAHHHPRPDSRAAVRHPTQAAKSKAPVSVRRCGCVGDGAAVHKSSVGQLRPFSRVGAAGRRDRRCSGRRGRPRDLRGARYSARWPTSPQVVKRHLRSLRMRSLATHLPSSLRPEQRPRQATGAWTNDQHGGESYLRRTCVGRPRGGSGRKWTEKPAPRGKWD